MSCAFWSNSHVSIIHPKYTMFRKQPARRETLFFFLKTRFDENLFGTSPEYWLNLQRDTDLWESLDLHRDDLERIEPLALGMVG